LFLQIFSSVAECHVPPEPATKKLALFKMGVSFIKDEVLVTIGCPIFPSILIAKYLFTGSLKNRLIDNLETQKKYISMTNSQFFNYLLYAKSK
jgi:hypothetical protein